MTKTEFVSAIARKADLTKETAKKAVDAMTATITEELAKHGDVQIVGFGTFKTKERAQRTGRNIQTGEEITIPARSVPVFAAGSQLKEAVK